MNNTMAVQVTMYLNESDKWKNRPLAEAGAHHSRVLQNVLFVQAGGGAIKFAHDHGKLSARVAEHCGPVHTLDSFQDEWPPCTCSIG